MSEPDGTYEIESLTDQLTKLKAENEALKRRKNFDTLAFAGMMAFEEDCQKEVTQLREQLSKKQEPCSQCEILKAKLYVAKDSQLRTYDGLADKADKYDELIKKGIIK